MKTHKINYLKLALVLALAAVISLLVLSSTAAQMAQTPPAPPPPGSNFDQRLAQRKLERKVVLERKDQVRLTSRCVNGQGKIRSMQQRTSGIVNGSMRTYQRLDGKLWVAIGQLKLAERDTFTLEKQRATLAAKVAAYQTTTTNYQQTLDDLLVINCKADVAGFKALLDTARLYHAQVRNQAVDIRTFVVNDIKATLNGHSSEMRIKPATEEDQ